MDELRFCVEMTDEILSPCDEGVAKYNLSLQHITFVNQTWLKVFLRELSYSSLRCAV